MKAEVDRLRTWEKIEDKGTYVVGSGSKKVSRSERSIFSTTSSILLFLLSSSSVLEAATVRLQPCRPRSSFPSGDAVVNSRGAISSKKLLKPFFFPTDQK